MSAVTLKYVRTQAGFTVFPCLSATHKQVADAGGWLPLSAGFVAWDVDGRPFCMGESDSLGIKSRDDDTAALRAEWGMNESSEPDALAALPPAAQAAARTFSAGLDDNSLEQAEVSL